MAPSFSFENPDDAIRSLADRLATTSIEGRATDCTDRVCAVDILADRDSPAADVSAMDGYAIRMRDLQSPEDIPIVGECAPGSPPPTMPDQGVLRIFTGAIVPSSADAVIKREDTVESQTTIRLSEAARGTQLGDHIRRAGENAVAGSTVISGGTRISAAVRATMANFGAETADVHEPVRVSIITTGDEVNSVGDATPEPWQLRNSNQSAITCLLSKHRWIKPLEPTHCHDDREFLAKTLRQQLEHSDAIILTGGVSMGDYDYVPEVVREVGGHVVFHGLPIRPGKPILGAATDQGKLILGLPGNPVSATIGCHRFALPLLAKMSGNKNWLPPCPVVRLNSAGEKTLSLHWMRLVRMQDTGSAEPVISKGSGDLVSLGQSDGYVEVAAGAKGDGPWPYHAW